MLRRFAFRCYVLRTVGINSTEALERERENTIPGTYYSMQRYSGRGMYQFAKVPWKFLKDLSGSGGCYGEWFRYYECAVQTTEWSSDSFWEKRNSLQSSKRDDPIFSACVWVEQNIQTYEVHIHPSCTPLQPLFSFVIYRFQLTPLKFSASSRFSPPPPAEEGASPWLLQAPFRSPRALHLALPCAKDRASVGLMNLQPLGQPAVSDPLPGRRPPGQHARQEGRQAKERRKRWRHP